MTDGQRSDEVEPDVDIDSEGNERFIHLEIAKPMVMVSDNEGDLEEMEEMAHSLLDDVVDAHCKLIEQSPGSSSGYSID